MDRVRNTSDLNHSRRWVMELLQNAGDTAYKESDGVDVKITLCDDRLYFEHTGRPFRIKDILSIINQVSSKDASNDTVGKFGTGFVSTFQLSEIVDIDSILKDEDLPYKKFHITIDRQGHDKNEILKSIDESMQELYRVDDNDLDGQFKKVDFNTRFTYYLSNTESKESARLGLEDLKQSVLYILLFTHNIKSITINMGDEQLNFKRGTDTEVYQNLYRLVIVENDKKYHNLLHIKNTSENIEIATTVDANDRFTGLGSNVSRLYAMFPLIGSEDFPFPVVINSLDFKVTEPRDGITLVDNVKSVDSVTNKRLINDAILLYDEFIDSVLVSGLFTGFEGIVEIPEYKEKKEHSESYIKDNVYKGLFNIISKYNIIKIADEEYTSIGNVTIIVGNNENGEKQLIYDIIHNYMDGIMVQLVGDEHWDTALKPYSKIDGIKVESINASKLLKNPFKYKIKSKVKLVDYANDLYKLSQLGYSELVNTGKAKIFPTQQCELVDINSVYIDKEIPEKFKEVSDRIDREFAFAKNLSRHRGNVRVQSHINLEIRKVLLDKEFKYTDGIKDYDVSKLIMYLSEYSSFNKGNINDIGNDTIISVNHKLLSCSDNEELYDCVDKLLDLAFGYGSVYKRLPESDYERFNGVWSKVLRNEVEIALKTIGVKYRSIHDFECICNIEDGIAWINNLLNFANTFRLDSRYYIMVAKDGSIFRYRNNAYIDDVSVEDMYKVYSTLVKDDIDELELALDTVEGENIFNSHKHIIDKRMNNAILKLQRFTDSMICGEVLNAVDKLLASKSLSNATEEEQDACTELANIIMNNNEYASKYLVRYSGEEEVMKLFTPKATQKLHRKAEELKVENEELRERIKQLEEKGVKPEIEIPEDTMINMGDITFDMSDIPTGMTLEDYCKQVGKAGEQYGLEYIKDKVLESGAVIIEEESGRIKLERDGESIIIIVGDTELKTQEGYDIRVEYGDKRIEYYEIKTHTSTSSCRNTLKLSRSQFKYSLEYINNFNVLKVEVSKELGLVGIKQFNIVSDTVNKKLTTDDITFYTE